MPSFSKNRFDTLAALLAAHFAVRDTVNSSEAIQKKGWEGLIGAQESAISTMDSFMRAQGPVAALEAEINRLRQKGLLEPHPHPLAGLGRTVARTFRQPITKILPSNKDYLWRLYQFSLKQAQAKRKGQVPVLAQQVWRVLLQAKDASGKPAFLAVNLRDPKSNPTGRLFGGQQLDTLQALVDRGALLRAEQLGDRKQWLQKGLRAAGVVVGEDLELRKQGASLEETSGWLLIRNNAPGAEAFYGAVDGFAKPPLHASLEFRKAYSLQEEASRWQNGFLLIHAGLGVLGMSARMPKPANTFKFSRTFKAIPSGLGTPIQERINLEHYDGGATIKIAAKTVIDTPPNLGNTAPGALSTPVTPDLTNLPGRLSLPDPKLPYLLIPVLVSQQQVHQAPILTAGAEELVTDHPKTRKKQIRYRKLEHIGYLAPATREEIAELLKLRNSGSYPDLETAKHKLSEQLQIYVLREGSDQGKVIATLALKPKAKNTWYMGQVAAIEGIGAGSTLAKGVLQDFQGMANHLNQHLTLEAYTLDPTNVYSTSPGKKSFYEKLNADCEDLDPRGPANMEMRSYENRIKLKWIFHPQTQPSNGQ